MGDSITGLQLEMVGKDGNAFAILGRAQHVMRKNRVDKAIIDQFIKEATSGDYDHLIQTCIKYFEAD